MRFLRTFLSLAQKPSIALVVTRRRLPAVSRPVFCGGLHRARPGGRQDAAALVSCLCDRATDNQPPMSQNERVRRLNGFYRDGILPTPAPSPTNNFGPTETPCRH